MKAKQCNRCRALTLIEVVIVVAVLAVLVAMLLPAMMRSRTKCCRTYCVNNLKQVGLSFRQWALDNNDKFPMQVPATNDGAMELAASGLAWPVFQVMADVLNTPKILICPEDKGRTNAPSFNRNLQNWELSYFVGLDADETQSQMILTGDSNLEIGGGRLRSGIVTLNTNRLVGWSSVRHKRQGNVSLSDGSVRGFTNSSFRQMLTTTGDLTNRVIIP